VWPAPTSTHGRRPTAGRKASTHLLQYHRDIIRQRLCIHLSPWALSLEKFSALTAKGRLSNHQVARVVGGGCPRGGRPTAQNKDARPVLWSLPTLHAPPKRPQVVTWTGDQFLRKSAEHGNSTPPPLLSSASPCDAAICRALAPRVPRPALQGTWRSGLEFLTSPARHLVTTSVAAPR
jgi:hypothetical protein